MYENGNKTNAYPDQSPAYVRIRAEDENGQPEPGLNPDGNAEQMKTPLTTAALRTIQNRSHPGSRSTRRIATLDEVIDNALQNSSRAGRRFRNVGRIGFGFGLASGLQMIKALGQESSLGPPDGGRRAALRGLRTQVDVQNSRPRISKHVFKAQSARARH